MEICPVDRAGGICVLVDERVEMMSGKLVKVEKIKPQAGSGNGHNDGVFCEYELECGHKVTSHTSPALLETQQQLLVKELPCFARCPKCLAAEKARGRRNGRIWRGGRDNVL